MATFRIGICSRAQARRLNAELEAARAFGAAFTVSAFGGVFGAAILAVSLPIILPVILAFGSPELFMLGVLGLTMVGALSGGSMLKGLTVATVMISIFFAFAGRGRRA